MKPFKLDPAKAAIYLPNRPLPESHTPFCRFTIGKTREALELPEIAAPREIAVFAPVVMNPPSRARSHRGPAQIRFDRDDGRGCRVTVPGSRFLFRYSQT